MKMVGTRKNTVLLSLVFLIFFLPRTIGLGWDITNYDARYWQPRMRNFVKAVLEGDLVGTYQKYHPGVTLMWLSGFADKTFDLVGQLVTGHNLRYLPRWYPLRHFVVKLPLVFAISVLGTIVFYFIRKYTDTRFALIFAFLFSLEPFFLGISRFLHLSALTAMLMFTSFILMYAYTRERHRFYFIFSATLSGLAVLTKMDGVLGAVISLLLLGGASFRSRSDLKNLRTWKAYALESLTYAAIAILIFFALWPVMWIKPYWAVRKMIGDGIMDTAFSSSGADMLVPFRELYYPEIFIFRSLPTTVLLVLLFPLLFFTRRSKELDSFLRANLLFLGVTWLVFAFPEKTKDRYLVDFYPSLLVLAAFSLQSILGRLHGAFYGLVVGLVCGFYLLTLYRYHPVYSFYYNDLLGGAAGRERLGLHIKHRGEYYAQAAFIINDDIRKRYPGEPLGNFNTVVANRNQDLSFRPYFYGKTFTDSKFMPAGYHAHYVVVRKDRLDRVPGTCTLFATLGPRAPLRYDQLYIFSCDRTVDNRCKFTH